MKHFIALLLLCGLLVSTAAAQSTIFIVRHAEKAQGEDPDLSEPGRARAESLANLLKDAGIAAIFTSEVKRTKQTAAPLARALHLEPITIAAKDRDSLIAKLKASSGNILVVGHSNTIPDLIKSLGITTPVTIADNDYDNLFVLVLDEKPRLLRLHFR
jgi:2,3-bisphosphoglycerate-dependent phosphoglycerate mutase